MNTKSNKEILLEQARNAKGLADHRGPIVRVIEYDLWWHDDIKKVAATAVSKLAATLQEGEERKRKRTPRVEKQFAMAAGVIMANAQRMMMGASTRKRWLCVFLNSNFYSSMNRYGSKHINYRAFIDAYECLKREGYIRIIREGYYDPKSGAGELTRIILNTKGVEWIASCGLEPRYRKDHRDGEVIILKADGLEDEGKRIDYDDTKFTKQARANLKKINQLLAKADIGLANKLREARDENDEIIDYSSKKLKRIFNKGRFDQGGRFYQGWWMGLSKDVRKHITINNKKTIELDFEELHPRMAYEKLKLSAPLKPYEVDGVKRKFGKIAFAALLNASGTPTTEPDDWHFERTRKGKTWKSFVAAVYERHSAIKSILKKGLGLGFQYQDSRIAELIMLKLAAEDVVCLPVHDSFIVQEEHQGLLRRTMAESSLRVLGIELPIGTK